MGATAALVALAPAAFAHHPLVSGTVACASDGTQVITWNIQNSETTAGTNRTMVITSAAASSGGITGLVGQTVKPLYRRHRLAASSTATTTLPGTQRQRDHHECTGSLGSPRWSR